MEQRFVPDATGVVHETVTFLLPVPSSRHAHIRLLRCPPVGKDCEDAGPRRSVRLVARDIPAATVALTADDADRLTATVGGDGFLAATARLCVTAEGDDGTGNEVFSAQLAADSGGALAGA